MTANPRSMDVAGFSRGHRDSIYPVIFLVPLDKAGEPDLDSGLRVKAEIAARGGDICEAFRHVAELQRQQLFLRGAAERPLDDGNKVEQLLGPGIAGVVAPGG